MNIIHSNKGGFFLQHMETILFFIFMTLVIVLISPNVFLSDRQMYRIQTIIDKIEDKLDKITNKIRDIFHK